jgi:thiamine-phosphate pyrophosphorylase
VFDLLLITDPAAPLGLAGSVRAALAAPAPGRLAVQLRAKQLSAPERLSLARELRALTRAAGAALLVNSDLEAALAVGAEGVQLPEGHSLLEARARLGPGACIGVSCHDAAGLERAAAGGASFATLSPVFASANKGTPLGVARFARLVAAAHLPVYALGGVQAADARALRQAGARGLAVISAVFASQQPSAAVAALLAGWDAA